MAEDLRAPFGFEAVRNINTNCVEAGLVNGAISEEKSGYNGARMSCLLVKVD